MTFQRTLVPFAVVGGIAFLTLLTAGCSGQPQVSMVPVRGAVKFTDGTIPQGEVATVFFEPVDIGAQATQPAPGVFRKAAFGDINPKDGSFQLTTVSPGDGAIAGKYKVIFQVHKTYLGRESLIPEKYTRAETTPFEVTVEPGCGPFTFELEKPRSK